MTTKATKAKKTDAIEVDDPPMTGPTMGHATHDGEPPRLTGREGDDMQTVTLIGGGPGPGTFRAAVPLPQVLISNGARYTLSDREQGVYAWQA